MKKRKTISDAFKTAFPHTIPVLTGFLFLGLTFGIYMNISGFSFWYPLLMSIIVYGGSLQFVAVSMLLSPFAPFQVLIISFMLQARHIFYGLSMLNKYKNTGWKKYYLIFGLCDETFSVNCSVDVPEGIDKGWFMTAVTFLNQMYWVLGSLVGGIFGSVINFNTEGLDFVMTAMFVVIFLNQLMKEKKHYSSIIGLLTSVVCLVIFGSNSFLIPTMLLILLVLTAFRKPIEKGGEPE